jgi:diguanylate cyclase (GGDEF)-like protein
VPARDDDVAPGTEVGHTDVCDVSDGQVGVTTDSLDPNVTSQLLAFVEGTSDLVGVVDEQSRVLYLNDAARKRLGMGDSAELTTADLFPPQTFARYYDEVRPALLRFGTWHGELDVLAGPGESMAMEMTVVARVGPGGEVDGLVTLGREVTTPSATSQASDLIHDELTGLPGRTILDDRMRVALAHAARDGRRVAAILVDVDAMKDINDSFGHGVGDDVLRELARTMSRGVRTSDAVARLGGDEFVVLLDGLDETDTVWQVAERLRDSVCRAPAELGTDVLVVSASFGVAVATPEDTPEELLQRADAAMYRAKAMGGAKVVVFADGADVSITALADELAYAVSHGLIRPHVQSVVDLHTGVLIGHQGIVRWEHPQRGLLDADQFVHFVANTPILPVIDLAVLRRTAAAAARTARSGMRVRAYGHLSRRLIGDVQIERYISEIVDDLGIAPSDLCVEIAHVLVARPSRTVKSTLRALREIGVRTVLSGVDGECEVNEIVEYGFDELRLARRLVRDAGRDPTRRRVAHGTIALARALGLTVIAVGIETDADRVNMRDAGCDYGQGNLFGVVRPAGAID